METESRELLAFTIGQFCDRHGISRAFFYKMIGTGEGPRLMRVGARVLVSRESAEAWRHAREVESIAPAKSESPAAA